MGFRLAVRHPERIAALISQNGNAYEEGLSEGWNPIQAYWQDPSPENRSALRAFLTPAATQWQYTHGVGDPQRLSPDAWTLDSALMARPGNDEIQLDLFGDYKSNVALYPKFQDVFPHVEGRRFSRCGARTIRSSCRPARKRSGATTQKPRSMCSMPGILPWRAGGPRSPRSFATSSPASAHGEVERGEDLGLAKKTPHPPLRGTFSPSARGEGKWGRHRSFPLAPRQQGEGARRAGEGWSSLQRKTPHPPLRGTFSPFKNGEKGNGGGTVPGHLLPVEGRGEGSKRGAAPFFPLAPRQRGEARAAGRGRPYRIPALVRARRFGHALDIPGQKFLDLILVWRERPGLVSGTRDAELLPAHEGCILAVRGSPYLG